MIGRSPRIAIDAFVAPLQRAISCTTREILIRDPNLRGQPQAFRFPRQTVRLRGRLRLEFSVLVEFDLEALHHPTRCRARSVGYRYELGQADGPMILAYHWHPVGVSQITWPHLHLGGSILGIDLAKAHLPTNFVALPDVVRFAIVDLTVEPMREDWREILTTS